MPRDVAAAAIGDITYYPEPGQSPTANYATFLFTVTAGGETSLQAASNTIRLVLRSQSAATGSPAITAQSQTAQSTWDEDILLTAAMDTVADANGISAGTIAWRWEQSPFRNRLYAAISGATAITFTPRQAQVGMYIRACISFMDMHIPPRLETVCSAGTQVMNISDAPVGADSVVNVSAEVTAANPYDFALSDFPIDDADGDTLNGIRIISLPTAGTLVAGQIIAAIGTELTLTQLNALAYYPDSGSAAMNGHDSFDYRVIDTGSAGANIATAEVTLTINLTVNRTPQGAIGMVLSDGGADLITTVAQRQTVRASATGLRDEDGLPVAEQLDFSWQLSTAVGLGWEEVAWDTDRYTPLSQDHVDKNLRLCVFYTDGRGTAEGGDPATENSRIRTASICSAPVRVTDVNDPPAHGLRHTSAVPASATADNPYRFKASDFWFIDPDGDMLAAIIFDTLIPGGTLTLNGRPVSTGTGNSITVTVAQLTAGALAWYPESGQQPANLYSTFVYTVVDDNDDGTGKNTASGVNFILIDLTSPDQMAATGAPTISPDTSAAEGTRLTASYLGIADLNSIDWRTLRWQWQVSATSTGTFAAIAGATAQEFVITQAHVDQYIRVCVTFRDRHATPAEEGPFCSAAVQTTNVNNAPVAQDGHINVPMGATMASPYAFKASDFPFADEDGDMLASVTLASLPASGALRNGSAAAMVGDTIVAADIADLTYYPAAGQSARSGYAEFTFNVTDDGSDGTGNKDSARPAAITINLITSVPTDATGAPTVTAALATDTAYLQDAPLVASADGITEPNGIQSAIRWQWQSAPAPASGPPASGAYTPLAGATDAIFTPRQAHAGMYIRACASFTDSIGTSEELCSAAARIVPTALRLRLRLFLEGPLR